MKDEYSLLNNVEVDFSQYVIEEVSEFEKKIMMKKFIDSKNKKVFWNKKKALVAVVALLLTINIGVHGDKVLAAVTSFKHNIDTFLGIENSGEKYSTQVGETLERKDTKLTLNEFFNDNSRIVINLNINRKINETAENYLKLVPDVYINGKKVERSSDYVGYSIVQIDEKKEDSNVNLEVDMKDLPLNDKEDVKLVFSNLAKECDAHDSDFTYSFVYDSTSYKNDSKVIKVDKNIIIGENELSLDEVTVTPDRVLISGSSKGFSAWKIDKDIKYYYDVVDENGNLVPLKEEIGKGAYFYRYCIGNELPLKQMEINTLKIVPYTFDKINTKTTSVSEDGATKYIIEDKIITINLK